MVMLRLLPVKIAEIQRRIVMLIFWVKRTYFFDAQNCIEAEFVAVTHDANAFLENWEAIGFCLENCLAGPYFLRISRRLLELQNGLRIYSRRSCILLWRTPMGIVCSILSIPFWSGTAEFATAPGLIMCNVALLRWCMEKTDLFLARTVRNVS